MHAEISSSDACSLTSHLRAVERCCTRTHKIPTVCHLVSGDVNTVFCIELLQLFRKGQVFRYRRLCR